MNIYLVTLSSRRVVPLSLQTQQDLLKPGDVSGIGSGSSDGFTLRIL
jgi:hypothetical protein